MLDRIQRYLEGMVQLRDYNAVRNVVNPIADRLSCQTLTSGALRIHGGSASALAATNAVYQGCVQGVLVTIANPTDMAALSGTILTTTWNVYCFFIDAASALTSAMGTSGTTQALIVMPAIPAGKTMIGYVLINPTGAGSFVGGTTALDDAGVVPNAIFVNTVGAFDPSILL